MLLRNKISLLILFAGAVACATAPKLYPEHPLVDEILKVRKDHDGMLTNSSGGEVGVKDAAPFVIKDYPVTDGAFRETANKFDFICNIGGKRYKICKDKAGFCRIGYIPSCFLIFCSEKEIEEDYVSIDKYQFLLDANARCANKKKYNLWSQSPK